MCRYKYVCHSSVPTASEKKKKDFVRSTRPGEVMATGEKTERQAPLFSALGFVTSPAVRGQRSETLR